MKSGDSMPFTTTLEAARNGSSGALGTILESCRNYISAIVVRELPRRLQGRLRPSSLVQETYLRACRSFDTFRGESERQWLAWLRQILIHCLLNELRRPEFRNPRDPLPEDLAVLTADPEHAAAEAERLRALEQALSRLPAQYRLVIELHHFNGITHAEIGRMLDCSSEAARKLWARAQIKLGEELRAFQ